MPSHYPASRLEALAKARCVLGGGGWLNRPAEAWPNVKAALKLLDEPGLALALPTPTSDPSDEIVRLRTLLRKTKGVNLIPTGWESWPTDEELTRDVPKANFFPVPGGNVAEYFARLNEAMRKLLAAKFLDGSAVFVGFSNGAVTWFDSIHTADRPFSEGGHVYPYYRIEAGLGAFPGAVCAHYNERNSITGLPRAYLFQEEMRKMPAGTVGFGIDTQAAIVLDRGSFRVLTRDRYAHVQRIIARGNDHIDMTALKAGEEPLTIEELYSAA